MHICFLSQEFPRPGVAYGGIGTFLITFSSSLIQDGHSVTIVGINGNEERDELIKDVRVVTFRSSRAKLIGWYRNFNRISNFLKELHKSNPIDIIEGSELTFAFLRKIEKVPHIIRLHGGHHFFAEGENRPINKWKGFQEKLSFKKADAFIAVSEYVKYHTGNLLSYANKPIQVINYPVSLQKFYIADPSKAISGRLVFAGTVCEKKGVKQLLLALPKVAKYYPDIHLEIYGRDWFFSNGKSYQQYLIDTLDSKILQSVTFHGPVAHDDLPAFYEQAELCVFPSHMETQGLVAPEAMAMGKVVIFSETGPGPETIDHGVNGYLCNPHSAERIADCILEALSQRQKHHEIGRNARQKVLGKFDPSLILEKNMKFYRSTQSSI